MPREDSRSSRCRQARGLQISFFYLCGQLVEKGTHMLDAARQGNPKAADDLSRFFGCQLGRREGRSWVQASIEQVRREPAGQLLEPGFRQR